MSEWILLPQLPKEGDSIWICLKNRMVIEGIYEKPWFKEYPIDEVSEMYSSKEIEAWMPYFTPEPPK